MDANSETLSPPASPTEEEVARESRRERRTGRTSRQRRENRSERSKRTGRSSRRKKVRDEPREDRELMDQPVVGDEESPMPEQSTAASGEDAKDDAADVNTEETGEDGDEERALPVEEPVQKDLFRTVPHILSSREKSLTTKLYTTRVTHNHPVTLTTLKNLRNQKENIGKLGAKYQAKSENNAHRQFLADECIRQEKALGDKVEKLEEEYSAVYRRVDKEKEGLFVNKPSFLMKHNKHIIEQRAFRSEGGIASCFDENGQLLYLSNPLKSIFTKPDEQEFGSEIADQIELKKTRPVLSTLTTASDRPEYRLDIDIKMIKFKDHELMIEEEYLVRQLLDMFESYTKRSKSSLIEYYSDKIKALKHSLNQMRDKLRALQQQNPMDEDTLREGNMNTTIEEQISILDRRMYKIRQELRENRKLLQEEQTHQVDIVNNIIRVWNQIKDVRKRQGFMVTRYGVTFQQIDHSEQEDLQSLEREVDDEVEEAREDAEYEFRQKQQIFDRTVINDDESLAEFPMLPDAPNFDERKMRKTIRKAIMSGRREPGSPEYVPQIGSIVRNEQQISESEEARGIAFRRYKYFIKVCINGHTVNHTKTKHLNRDFTVVFGEILPISLYKWPENIVLQIYCKDNLLKNRKVASIFVQAPGATSQAESSDLGSAVSENSSLEQNLIFSEEKSHIALWNENQLHNNSGDVQVRLHWTDQIPPYQPPKVTGPVNSKKLNLTDDTHLPNAKDLLDMQNIQKWMKGNKIDPNDPKNTGLMSMLELLEDKILTRQGFYLAEQDDDLFISQYNDMRYKKRLERLKEMDDAYTKRKRKQFVSKYVREPPLPALNWGILSSLWAFFEPRRPLKPTRRDRTQDVPRRIEEANMFIQIIRGHNIPVRAVTNEFHKHRERMYQQKEQIMDQQLNTNRSLRPGTTLDAPLLSDTALPGDDTQDESVVSFVSCYFQGRTRKTKIVEGPYPQFNQTITMPITVPNNDFSSDVVKSVRDVLYFDIFDEITITNVKDDQYLHDLSRRAEFRWIGGFSIPFSTLYRAGKVLGTFTVRTPPINLGYKYRDESDNTTRLTICITVDPPLPQPEDITDSISSGELPALFSYVNWWTKIMENNPNCKNRIITALEPNNYGKATLICRYICPQKPPDILFTGEDFQQTTAPSEMSSDEDEDQRNRTTQQLDETRDSSTLGDDVAAGATSTTHAPLSANVNISGLSREKRNQLVHKCARFVSLIPFVDDIVSFLERTDVWQTSHEFLADGGGDDEEHANLLCNYFKYLQKKAWVVIGRAVPEGECSYVLTEEEREVDNRSGFTSMQKYFLLWNAATGEAFDSTDPTCPIYEVGVIFDETNVWANIQRSAKPHLISFDLNNRSHWQPLFRGSKMKSLLPGGVISTIQDRDLPYKPIASGVNVTMEFEIMNDVKTGVEDNRKDVTIWSTHVGKELRQILIELERCKQNNEVFSRKKQALMLKGITDTHHVIGFPLNFTYVNNETIVREVLNTKIHEHQDSDVRFACGVYVHPYVNNVFSVWIYITVFSGSMDLNYG